MFFQCQNTKHGRITSRSNGHGLECREIAGQFHQALALNLGALGHQAPTGLAIAPTVVNEAVSHFPIGMRGSQDHTGAINATDHGPLPHNGRGVGDGQCIFVIQGGVFNADFDIPFGQVRVLQGLNGHFEFFIFS